MARPSSGPVPERIGRYDVLLRIASGGMAAVYLARSRGVGGFQREVAIKLTHPHLRSNPDFAADLIEEAKLAVRIRHPNVVPIVDVGEDAEGVFLVMDYVEGDSLSGLLRRGIEAGEPLPLGIGMRILIDALAGLHAAHELLDDSGRPLGIVHRDFTPQNLLIGIDGVARLADFGIARAAGRVGQTRVGTVKGKITYMAPEQARSRTLDRRCDVWAAGVVAWELLAGRRLHENVESEVGLMYKIVSEPPPRLRTVVPQVSQQFDHAVASALMLEADERTPSAAMLARDLTAACRAYGHLAELDEVAAYVQRVVGPKLARRRDRINQSATMRAAAFHLGQPPPSEIPAELSSEVEISVEETGGEVAPSNLELSSAIRFDALEPVRTDTTSSVGSPTARPAAKIKRTGTIAAIATAAIGVVLLASAAVVWRTHAVRASTGDEQPQTATAGASTAATPATIETGASEATSAMAQSAQVPPLRVHASERVSSLRVGTRVVRLSTPTQDALVDILAEERARELTVHAVSIDGRQAAVTLPAGAMLATLVFPQVRTAPPPPKPTLGRTTSKPPPLAGSPY